MKPVYYIILLLLLSLFGQECFAQQRTTRRRPSDETPDNTPNLTERARIKNEVNSRAPGQTVWLREMYRYIDLEKEANAPLLYPTEPIGDRKNLFTLIFRLVLDGKIDVYNFLDGKEIFNESEKIDIGAMLTKQQIYHTTQGTGENVKFIVEDMDLPGAQVTLYMIKESWFFDAATGNFTSRVLALCPILIRMDYETGVENREPLFWVTYEDIRPYISREVIMTSNYNNALTYTIDDFFTKRMYDGEIIKTTNLMNQSLAQQIGSSEPEALKAAQDSIEKQLKAFEKQLWVQPDTTQIADKGKKEDKKSSSSSTPSRGQKAEKAEKTKTEKSSSPSTPTKSVRRSRGR